MSQTEAERFESLTDWARMKASVITYPIARVLHRWGFHPNTITLLGLGLTVGVSVVVGLGYTRLGGVLLLLASSLDALDGALARVGGERSRFGAFLDSTLDRISEGALMCGLLVALYPRGSALEVYLIFATLLGSQLVSYTRARAEGVGYTCKTGLLTRVERVLLLGVGLIFNWIRPVLILLAVLSWFTVLQRIFYVYREARRDP
ncbi:MAG TPA: CDP-alcohol phosphatidyltransferase family protein [Anaerolineae bacterium]|nr:CDP-alcohol phosphatidyltransferase family protein [Anaerolineae bacterium]HOV47752.1 CDP-alcohol phosphatidyltransferase family protein [Anaerolineae bacterium]HRU95726.1 CDP-alcohol phosphatidyltransferase family protein [Anaerolineae bacterium]HXK41856.1 CDP-alcohol phosphatidyltransferase family protein [Anaerolineae bacterium]